MAQKTILRTVTAVTILAALSVAMPAAAQTVTTPSRPAQPTTQVAAPVGQSAAPTGHRQPRVSDVPQEQSGSAYAPLDRPSPEDEALNRRINGICRGC